MKHDLCDKSNNEDEYKKIWKEGNLTNADENLKNDDATHKVH